MINNFKMAVKKITRRNEDQDKINFVFLIDLQIQKRKQSKIKLMHY